MAATSALRTVEDVAVLQRPSVRDAVADDLVDGRAAGLGEVVVVERRRVAVPRRAGLARAKHSAGTLQPRLTAGGRPRTAADQQRRQKPRH